MGALPRLEGRAGRDAAVEHDHGGTSASEDAHELVVVRGESDDVEAFGFEDETEEPVRPLGLAEDNLHCSLVIHLRQSSGLSASWFGPGVIVRPADRDL